MRRFTLLLLIIAMVFGWSTAAPTIAAAKPVYPSSVPLPDGFYPEGIAVGRGHSFYVGSLLNGAIYKGDLRTGEGDVISSSAPGRVVAGLSFDERSGLLWAAGSDGGTTAVLVFDGRSGELVADVAVPGGAFLNDLTVTREAVYVTDSLAAVLWRIPLDNRGQPAGPPQAIPLTGDFTFVTTGQLPINLNGIVATRNGATLIAVHSSLGVLYRIDPTSGEATEIDLGGAAVPSGDGLVLQGKTLYVVQNFLNQVTVIELDGDYVTGAITDVITSGLFRVPTTAAKFGSSLYLVNARFDAALPPFLGGPVLSIDYDVVRVAA